MKNNEQMGKGFRKQHPKDVLFYILLRKAPQPYKTHESTDQLGVFPAVWTNISLNQKIGSYQNVMKIILNDVSSMIRSVHYLSYSYIIFGSISI